MPYRYGSKRVAGFWIDEELLRRAAEVAMQLGYDSFSSFVNDLIREAIAAAEVTEALGIKREGKRKLVLQHIFAKVKTLIKRK
ncbi:MAG: hypothetical protein ACXQTI_10930 [Candidatus Nezhaarchaeales archaeon]